MSESVALDTCGLLCPLPVIRTQDTIKRLNVGDTLKVLASDPGTLHDIPAWVKVHGHELVSAEPVNNNFHFEIRVRDS